MWVQLDGHHRIERQSRTIDADPLPRRLGADCLADQREDERLGDALDRELAFGVPRGVDSAVCLDHAKAK
jgi:hypothetical protein